MKLVMTDMVSEFFNEIELPAYHERVDRHFAAADLDTLTASTIAVGKTRLVLPAFKIPKKGNEDSRFLLNGKLFDELLKKTSFELPKMGIEPIDVFLRAFLRYRKIATRDATSFFYQIGVPDSLSELLGMRIGAGRGEFLAARMLRLPMGVCFAPAVAQAISNLVCDLVRDMLKHIEFFAEAWVDNFIFCADNDEDMNLVLSTFQQICETISLDCKPAEHVDNNNEIALLGMTVVPGEHVRCPFLLDDLNKTSTARQTMKQIGKLFWANSTVGRFPMCCFPNLMQWLRGACTRQEWDSPTTTTQQFKDELKDLAEQLTIAVLTTEILNDDVTPNHIVWSDASKKLLGAVSQVGMVDIDWFATPTPRDLWTDKDVFLIFIAEALAWARAALAWATPQPTLYAIDNTALTRAIIKGHSGNGIVDAILHHVFLTLKSRHNYVAWVSTDLERADKPSRDGEPPDLKPWLPQEMRRCRWRKVANKKGGL